MKYTTNGYMMDGFSVKFYVLLYVDDDYSANMLRNNLWTEHRITGDPYFEKSFDDLQDAINCYMQCHTSNYITLSDCAIHAEFCMNDTVVGNSYVDDIPYVNSLAKKLNAEKIKRLESRIEELQNELNEFSCIASLDDKTKKTILDYAKQKQEEMK